MLGGIFQGEYFGKDSFFGLVYAAGIALSVMMGKRFSKRVRYFAWLVLGAFAGWFAAVVSLKDFDAIPNIILTAIGVTVGLGISDNHLQTT